MRGRGHQSDSANGQIFSIHQQLLIQNNGCWQTREFCLSLIIVSLPATVKLDSFHHRGSRLDSILPFLKDPFRDINFLPVKHSKSIFLHWALVQWPKILSAMVSCAIFFQVFLHWYSSSLSSMVSCCMPCYRVHRLFQVKVSCSAQVFEERASSILLHAMYRLFQPWYFPVCYAGRVAWFSVSLSKQNCRAFPYTVNSVLMSQLSI